MADTPFNRTPGVHLSGEQLARLEEGTANAAERAHLAECSQCAQQFGEWRSGLRLYQAFAAEEKPHVPEPPAAWRSLDSLIAANAKSKQPRRWWRGWPALAFGASAALVALGLLVLRPRDVDAGSILAESAERNAVSAPSVRVSLNDVAYLRPAVYRPGEGDVRFQKVERLFNDAGYSWAEPMSARSYVRWRAQLRDKQDHVTVVRNAREQKQFRVETRTSSSSLRDASLTLNESDLRAVAARFDFASGEAVRMEESAELPPSLPPSSVSSRSRTSVAEEPASPEDTLRVLDALNRIGADAGDPVDVTLDRSKGVVVVRMDGVSPVRKQQISAALHGIPRVRTEEAPAGSRGTGSSAAERNSSQIPPEFRRQLEKSLGGALALQEVTDDVLDQSSVIAAHAHAVAVLAREFPQPVEGNLSSSGKILLGNLKNLHLNEVIRLKSLIFSQLKAALPASSSWSPAPLSGSAAESGWQARVPLLVDSARQTDLLLNRVFAGSYAQGEAASLLVELRRQLDRLEGVAQSLRNGGP